MSLRRSYECYLPVESGQITKLLRAIACPGQGALENIWVVLDRDHRSDTLFLVLFCFVFFWFTLCKSTYTYRIYTYHVIIQTH